MSSESSISVQPQKEEIVVQNAVNVGRAPEVTPEVISPTVPNGVSTPTYGCHLCKGMGMGGMGGGFGPGMGGGPGLGVGPGFDPGMGPIMDPVMEPDEPDVFGPTDPEAMNAMIAAWNSRFRRFVGIQANLTAKWKNDNILGQFEVGQFGTSKANLFIIMI